ncbi:MAG: hypothetical protein KBS57_04570 [Alistipes sp.]|nr:hypothetical protein [Candidatus Minthomonas equi]
MKKRLAEMVDAERAGHAIMLEEKGGYGAVPLAVALIQYLSCRNRRDGDSCGECESCRRIDRMVHPDVHYVFPVNTTQKSGGEKKPVSSTFYQEWKKLVKDNPYFTEAELYDALGIEDKVGTISVQEAKEILNTMNLHSFEGGNRYMVIYLPERMTAETANKLLKIIEEPFPGSYFIFITQSPEKVIDTIRSRCLRIALQPVPMDSRKDSQEFMEFFTSLMDAALQNDLQTILKTCETIASIGRERQKRFCLFAEECLRTIMMTRLGIVNGESPAPISAKYAKIFPEPFFETAYHVFDNAKQSIEGNVNPKITFCNMGNLLFVNIRKLS